MSVVGFIGLGAMGLPMCRNLVRAGFEVRCYDVSAEQMARAIGAQPTQSIAECVAGADFAVTMLPNSPDVAAVATSPDGLLSSLPAGAIWVDMSTISPVVTKSLAETASNLGIGFLDAPVSGGVNGAEAGSLSIMVGGDAALIETARPVLAAVGATITHVGPNGAGQGTKACNQIVVACNIMAACEGLLLARQLGLDLDAMREVWAGGAAGSWMIDNLVPKMLADGHRWLDGGLLVDRRGGCETRLVRRSEGPRPDRANGVSPMGAGQLRKCRQARDPA